MSDHCNKRRPARKPHARTRGFRADSLWYDSGFVSPVERQAVEEMLATIHPIWEDRYSPNHPPPEGSTARRLLRPVYWLGSWQFACLDYYRPPHGIDGRAIQAEPFPAALASLVARIEALVHRTFDPGDVPRGWELNTCLVNMYGARVEAGRREDVARVGEHRDFEPGPVASISIGERALFQFVNSGRPGTRENVVLQQWLDDRSLLVFAGDRWKKKTFHRVQRVDRKAKERFDIPVEGFETRRVNFTFRWVPREHMTTYARLAPPSRDDVRGYVTELAGHSDFFARALLEEKLQLL